MLTRETQGRTLKKSKRNIVWSLTVLCLDTITRKPMLRQQLCWPRYWDRCLLTECVYLYFLFCSPSFPTFRQWPLVNQLPANWEVKYQHWHNILFSHHRNYVYQIFLKTSVLNEPLVQNSYKSVKLYYSDTKGHLMKINLICSIIPTATVGVISSSGKNYDFLSSSL